MNKLWLLGGISAFALAASAQAQATGTAATQDMSPETGATASPAGAPNQADQSGAASTETPVGAQTDDGAGSGASAAAEIVVTGSRVIRTGKDAPQPVTMVQSADLLQTQPTTLADGLNALPNFAGSTGPRSSVSVGTGNAGGNGAANTLNLRNLGANRNLILLDGQRVPNALYTGAVDVDLMPEMLIQRVDLVTGGVSAVYGSDAVSGVINFIIDKKFNGLKAEVQSGISQRGDGGQRKAGFAYGTGLFGDRGHFEVSYTRFDSTIIPFRTDRPFAYDYAYGGAIGNTAAAGSAANPYVIYSGARNYNTSRGGLIKNGIFAGQQFANDGVLSPFNTGVKTSSPNLGIGGDGVFQNPSLGASQHNNQMFGRFSYDFSDAFRVHVQALGEIKNNVAYSNYTQLTNFTISACNAYLAPAYRTALGCTNPAFNATGQPTFTFNRFLSQGQRIRTDVDTYQYDFNGGIDGNFGGKFNYAIDFSYGRSVLHNAISGNGNNQHISAAADAVVDPGTGQIVCRSTLTNPGSNAGCVPINLFGPTAASQAALNYLYGTTHLRSVNTDIDLNGHVGGELFDFGAGPARFAVTGQFRRNTLEASTDFPPTVLADCTGLRYNCVSSTSTTAAPTTLYQNIFSNRSEVSEEVREGAVEVNVPLLRNSPVGKLIEVNGAARYTSYTTSGNYWTWKVGLNYQATDSLRFRGTASRDIRAPTLYDLFQTPSTNLVNNADLLTNTNPNVRAIQTGNPNLTAEIGRTFTAGAVFQAPFLRGLTATLDFYHIKLSNAISVVSGFDPSIQQACYTSGGSSPYCALQVRPNGYTDRSAANAVTLWYTTSVNVAQVKTYGVDGELDYSTRLFNRPAAFRLFATWQPHIYYYQPGLPRYDSGGAAYNPLVSGTGAATSHYRVTGFAHLEPIAGVGLDVREQWRSGLRYNANPTLFFAQKVAPAAYTDLTLTFSPPQAHRFEFFLNVQNLLDKKPPAFQIGSLPGQGFVPGDDFIGRYFTGGARVRF